jgi:flagellar M-ring protein FliF
MFELIKTRFNTATAGFNNSQRITMMVAFVAVIAGVLVFANTATKDRMAPLYTGLSTSDAAAVTETLRDLSFTYEITDRGGTVLVPENDIYEARLQVNRSGFTPTAESDGFSTLDGLGITSTQFQQRIAYQRGLAQEIEMSLTQMETVDSADVHLVIPEDDLFSGDDIKASASVLISSRGTITSTQVAAITSLVANAVEGLTAEQVTVTDQRGNVLAGPEAASQSAKSDRERTAELEDETEARILSLVEAVVGPGNARVAVNATVDWTNSTTVSEAFTPVTDANGTQLRTSVSSSVETNTLDEAQGILGAGDVTELNDGNVVAAQIDSSFLVDRAVTTVENTGGEITSMTASVILNQAALADGDLTAITQAVATASGLSAEAGTLTVAALPFDTSIAEELAVSSAESAAAQAIEAEQQAKNDFLRTVGTLGVAAIVGLFALLSFRRARKEMKKAEAEKRQQMAALATPITDSKASDASLHLPPVERLALVAQEQPAEIAELLNSWVGDRVGASQ